MENLKLSNSAEQCLHEQVIDAERPGPVLHDFRAMLDFVPSEGFKVAGKHNLLPMNAIGELDQRLSRPLQLEMKRPQLRSHPYLQGLYLLLRSSGLSRIVGSGDKARLVLDQAMRAAWDALNPTEQFFTLLEAWLRHGRAEMIGEYSSRHGDLLSPCLGAWRSLRSKSQKFDAARREYNYIFGMNRDLYQMALMDLFGLLAVEHPSQAVQPWGPAGIKHVPFGDALFTLLGSCQFSQWDEDGEQQDEQGGAPAARFGMWQSIFQPYFPEWRNNLTLPAAKLREGTHIFRAALGAVWRRIAMPSKASLDLLVDWILRSMNFDNDHLYEIGYRDRFGAKLRICHPEMEEGPWADQIRIGDLPVEEGQLMTLVYDFGDSWQFDVTLESIEQPLKKLKSPRVLEKHGKAPKQYEAWQDW